MIIHKLSILLLASGTMCIGQAVLTTPASEMQLANQRASQSGTTRAPLQTPEQPDHQTMTDTTDQTTPIRPGQERLSLTDNNARVAGPIKTKSEFQRFAEEGTGRLLPVFGRQLFDQVPSTFAPVENTPVPANYVLGPGDELLIRAWGKIELNARVTVDRNGQIDLPRVGTLTVAGLQYTQLHGFMQSAIGALYKDFELSVSLGELRSIQVFVLGQARQPGAYTISSLSTLVDALFASGGPSATGSMRRVQLRREDKTVTEFDLYDLIERGDKSHDMRLLPGDVIFIPSIGPQIAISGDVNQPGIYELKGETTVAAALSGAGGLTSLADAERAVLERIENHRSREVQEFALDAEGKARLLKDGDLLRVFPLSPKITNAVTLRGSVAQPGLYLWRKGMRVTDLIPSRSFLVTRRYWNRQNALARPERNGAYGRRKIGASENPVENATENVFTDGPDSTAAGADGDQRGATFAGTYDETQERPRADSSRNNQSDPSGGVTSNTVAAIGQNSAEVNWEYALIERLDERDLSTQLIPFRLASAIDNPTSADNHILEPGDVVTIFARSDIELPMEKHASFVRVGGEVNAPGFYRVQPGETLREVVEKAGGLTRHSYLYASIFTRLSTRQAQEKQLRESSEQMQRDLMTQYANSAQQTSQSATGQHSQLALQQAALARLTAIKPTGRVVLNMTPDAATVADLPDLPLEDGDALYIPPRLSTVQVTGAVYNTNAFRYEPGERLITYLNDAGGATRDADQRRIFVIRADGTVVSSRSKNLKTRGGFKNLRLLPGDAIVVPEKLRISSKMSEFLQMSQFMSQMALTSAALSVIR